MDGSSDKSVPLVVDADRALIATDPRWEALARVIFSRPRRLARALIWLLGGGRPSRGWVSGEATPDPTLVPLHQGVSDLVAEVRADGRAVVLVSKARREQAEALARRVGADGFVAGVAVDDGERLRRVRSFASTFDYVGDTASDPLADAARRKVTWSRARWRRDGSGQGPRQRPRR